MTLEPLNAQIAMEKDIMKIENFKAGQEYIITKNILIMGDLSIGQRNAFFQKGLHLIVECINLSAKIVGFREKNSGVGLDLYPEHPCIKNSLSRLKNSP